MPFTAAFSTAPETTKAFDDVCRDALEQLPDKPDLAMLFLSPHHARQAEDLAAMAKRRLVPRCLLGCTGETVVGNGRELEEGPALSLWLGKWKTAVELQPFHLVWERMPEEPSILGWPDGLVGAAPDQATMLLLGDPFSFPVDDFLRQVNENHPGVRVMGGMASGARGPGQSRLLFNDRVFRQGAVGVLLQGPIRVRSIVSQGCRPVGRHFVVTRARDNFITELGGKPPLVQLRDLWQDLNADDRELLQQGLHIGRVLNEYQDKFERGDFLVRNVMGVDQDTGALAITDRVRVGQTVQFHVRDAASADEDLHELLKRNRESQQGNPAGALLFSCNGRGTRLFAEPDHDARAVRAEAGNVPLAGFFAAGELGPVGGQNFIHGFTASVVLFEE